MITYLSKFSTLFIDLCLVVSIQTNHMCHVTSTQLRDYFFTYKVFSSLSPCWFFICGGECRKSPRYVPYECTYVPYDGTFGASDQGQTLDMWGWHPADVNAEYVLTPDVTTSPQKIPWTSQDISVGISADLWDHTGWIQGWIQFNGCSVR